LNTLYISTVCFRIFDLLQMDLTRNIEEVASNRAIPISALVINRKYPIVETQYVVTKLWTYRFPKSCNTIKVIIPKRHSTVFS
jgi:hypothetical protein